MTVPKSEVTITTVIIGVVQQNKVIAKMKCIRLVQNKPSYNQVEYLLRTYHDLTVENIETFSIVFSLNPTKSIALFDKIVGDAEIVEVALPFVLLNAITKYSEWFKKPSSSLIRSVFIDGEFSHYERIIKVEIVTEKL